MYGKGISREGSLLDIGVDLGIVKKSGAWYTYDGEQLGQGRENAKQFLIDNPEIMVEISERIRTAARHRAGATKGRRHDVAGRRRAPSRSTTDVTIARRCGPAVCRRRGGCRHTSRARSPSASR